MRLFISTRSRITPRQRGFISRRWYSRRNVQTLAERSRLSVGWQGLRRPSRIGLRQSRTWLRSLKSSRVSAVRTARNCVSSCTTSRSFRTFRGPSQRQNKTSRERLLFERVNIRRRLWRSPRASTTWRSSSLVAGVMGMPTRYTCAPGRSARRRMARATIRLCQSSTTLLPITRSKGMTMKPSVSTGRS